MEKINYNKLIWKKVLNEKNNLCLWTIYDIILDTKNLKIEWAFLKKWFFDEGKIIEKDFFLRNGYKLFSNEEEIYNLSLAPKSIEKILEKEDSIILKKVFDEFWNEIWNIFDLIFLKNSLSVNFLVIRKNFFWLFFYWENIIFPVENILKNSKEKIIIKSLEGFKV
jgi:hypothetical protein